jgi:hypothetical protein
MKFFVIFLILLGIGIFGFMGSTFAQEQSLPPCMSSRDACMEPPICENTRWDCSTSEGIFVDYEIIPWGDFEYDFNNDAQIFTKNMTPRSIVVAGEQFFVIQKVDFSDDNFAKNSTFNAVVGYALQKGDNLIPFPKGENVTDADHQEFSQKNRKLNNEFYQESEIAKSFEFVVDPEKPFFVKSSLTIQESGLYTHQFYKKLKFSPDVSNSNMGSTAVVEKLSKAIDEENGVCKNDDFRRLIKHDYSTLVCVDSETAWKLIGRGWGI